MAEHAGLTLPQALEKPGTPSRSEQRCAEHIFETCFFKNLPFLSFLKQFVHLSTLFSWKNWNSLGATDAENSKKSQPVVWSVHGRHMVCWRSRRFSNCRAELAQADPNSEAWGILGQPLLWLVWLVLVWCVLCQDVLGWKLLNTFDAPECKGATGRNGPIRKWPLRRPDRRRVKRQTRSLPKLHVEEFCRAESHVAKKIDIDWLLLAYLLNNLSIPTCLYSQYETFQGHPTNRPSQPFFRHRTCWMVQ